MKTLSMLVVAALSLSAFARDDEPDGLSWELFSQDRDILLHFYDWAKTNPPPSQTSQTYQTSQTFPFVWIRPHELPRRYWDILKGWTESTNGVGTVADRTGVTFRGEDQFFEVPEDGTYRLWVRYPPKRPAGRILVTPAFDEEHPETAPADAMFAVFDQRMTGRDIRITSWQRRDALAWEGTHKTAFLRKGRYRIRHEKGFVTDFALIGDPFFAPVNLKKETSEAGRLPVPEETRSPLYAIRPGSVDINEVDPALAAWWMKWREAFYGRLLAAARANENSVWKDLATLPAFDERLNAVDLLPRLRLLAEKTDRPNDIYRFRGAELKLDGDWDAVTSQWSKVNCPGAIILRGRGKGRAVRTFDVRRAGSYRLFIREFLPQMPKDFARGAMTLKVSAGGRTLATCELGLPAEGIRNVKSAADLEEEVTTVKDGKVVVERKRQKKRQDSSAWEDESIELDSDLADGLEEEKKPVGRRPSLVDEYVQRWMWEATDSIALPAGEVTVSLEGSKPWSEPDRPDHVMNPILCRMALVLRDDYNPTLEGAYSLGDRVGDGEIGFWRTPDRWKLVKRYQSAPSTAEVNRAEHEVGAASGEVLAERVVVRNNTDELKWIEPRLTGELGGRVRLAAWWILGQDPPECFPRILLDRRRIALPPRQNAVLWVNIDCRGAKEGRHDAVLSFGGLRHTWHVSVKGSIEGVKGPWCFTWSQPAYRKSSFEMFRDYGFNVIQTNDRRWWTFREMSKRAADEYGLRLVREFVPTRTRHPYEACMKTAITDWRRRGFAYEDVCYYVIDEPGFDAREAWMQRVKDIKAADPQARIWCNTGFFPSESQWEASQEFMSTWDVFCPFRTAFGKGRGNPEHVAAYKRIGNPMFCYSTPNRWQNSLIIDAPAILYLARDYRREGCDGWAVVRMDSCTDWTFSDATHQTAFAGAWGRVLSTLTAEAGREVNTWWRKMDAGVIAK